MFYFILYRTELLPRYVSIWGLAAAVLMIVFNALIYTGIDLGIINLILVLPMIANEFFVAFWLILKGVNTANLSPE